MGRVRSFRTAAVGLLPLALTLVSCHRPAFVLPTGSGVPAPDASSIWTSATRACRDARTLSAEVRLSGRAGSIRIRQRVLVGVTSAGQLRLEVPAPFGRPVFVIAGSLERATLVSRDNHVLTARADDILDAFVGLRLGPAALVPMLTGCGRAGEPAGPALRFGEIVSIGEPGSRVFIRSAGAAARVVAAEIPGWIVEYHDGPDGWPAEVRVRSAADRQPAIDLRMALSQVEVNTQLVPAAFTVVPPRDATPLTLEQLREGGPLGGKR